MGTYVKGRLSLVVTVVTTVRALLFFVVTRLLVFRVMVLSIRLCRLDFGASLTG